MWKHRNSLDIMAEILGIAMNGELKTPIMYKANLSFAQFSEYLSFLLEIGLLKNVNNGGKTVYKTSVKGLQYIQGYEKLTALLDMGERNRSGGKRSPIREKILPS